MALTDALVVVLVAIAAQIGTTLAAVLAFRTAWSAQKQLAELQRKVWIQELTKTSGRAADAMGITMATNSPAERVDRNIFHQEDVLMDGSE